MVVCRIEGPVQALSLDEMHRPSSVVSPSHQSQLAASQSEPALPL